jgi:hypothetical protein
MWRSMFIALGIFLCLLGAEFLACDHLVLRNSLQEPAAGNANSAVTMVSVSTPQPGPRRIYVPKDWMPWTLLASGAIVLMYSVRPRG